MRAVGVKNFGDVENLTAEEVEPPVAGPGEPGALRATLRQMIEMCERGALQTTMTETYLLEEAPAALARLRRGRLMRRIVLTT